MGADRRLSDAEAGHEDGGAPCARGRGRGWRSDGTGRAGGRAAERGHDRAGAGAARPLPKDAERSA